MNRISDEHMLKEVFAIGAIPAIDEVIRRYNDKEIKSLYECMNYIGEVVNTYYELFQTGNRIDRKAVEE